MAGFKDLIGHKQEIAHLQQAIDSGKVSHAYIFNGEKGNGKNRLAEAFAQTLQCSSEGERPCGCCHSCHQAESGNHPDIIHVTHEKPTSIGVEDVRDQLVGDMQIRPYNGKYKIYIIPDAEKMTVQAQNASLKTIEEPPEYAVIILLTTNSQTLLDTIRSRCVLLNLKPVPDELVKAYLMDEIHVPDYEADICVAFAQGNVGKAVRLASSEDFTAIKASAMRLIKNAGRMQISELIEYVKEVQEYKISIQDYLDILALWYRDMVYFKATRDINGLIFRDELRTIRDTVKVCSYEGVEEVMKAIENAKARLNANVNFDLTMELLFLVIKENIHG
jgi:DNA polymerase-3 subunit delta'